MASSDLYEVIIQKGCDDVGVRSRSAGKVTADFSDRDLEADTRRISIHRAAKVQVSKDKGVRRLGIPRLLSYTHLTLPTIHSV